MPWEELDAGNAIERIVGSPVAAPDEVIKYLVLVPRRDEWLRVETTSDSSSTGFSKQLGRTRLFVDLGACRNARGDLMAALATYAATQNLPLSAFMGLAAKVAESVRVLTRSDARVLTALWGASSKPHEESVPVEKVAEILGEDEKTTTDLLEDMQSRGIVVKRSGGYCIAK